jgi:hypothetical protein
MHKRRTLARTTALALSVLISFPALSWGGVTTGKIAFVHVTGAGNLPFRVNLEGGPVLCAGGMSEGYLDDTDANYRTYVATLLMAKATGATVTLYADVGSSSRCRIGYILLQ